MLLKEWQMLRIYSKRWQTMAKIAVNDNDNVNDSVNVIDIDIKDCFFE